MLNTFDIKISFFTCTLCFSLKLASLSYYEKRVPLFTNSM